MIQTSCSPWVSLIWYEATSISTTSLFLFKELSFDIKKACLIYTIAVSGYIAKKISYTHFLNLLVCISCHPQALFCRSKGIILMLENFHEGETDKSYDKTINLRELKIFFEHLFRIITYTLCMHTEKRIADMSVKSFEFTAAVWWSHVYWDTWLPYINETLKCLHELGNAYDVFAIKYIKWNDIWAYIKWLLGIL